MRGIRTLLENGAICINWLIDDGLPFSSLCHLLPLDSNLLLCLCLASNDGRLGLLDDDLLGLALLALHLSALRVGPVLLVGICFCLLGWANRSGGWWPVPGV